MLTEAADRSGAQRPQKISANHVPCEAILLPMKNYWLATFILQCQRWRVCHTIKGVGSLWCCIQHSQTDMSCTKLPGTRSNSRHTSGSMLSGSKHLDAERSKIQSKNYWKNDMCISVGSCLLRTYCLAKTLLTSELPPLSSSVSYM
jgi:hypothetical protein